MREKIDDIDAVVIGSGFGGSVLAFRLAEAGHSVIVLERGRRYPPGSFARTPAEISRSFWDPSQGLQGLFDIWSFRNIEAVVSSGLGGGSLIYANVLLRKDERWFVHDTRAGDGYENWPVSRADLEAGYDRAERMLGANVYPYADRTPKTIALSRSAERLGLDWFPAPLAISFAEEDQQPGDPLHGRAGHPENNIHGATRLSCRLCGECDLGCNTGSKNTLDYTYLSAAKRAQAQLWDRCEVRTVAAGDDGEFDVGYVRHEPENEGVRTDTSRLRVQTIRSKVVVMAAGAIGSTYLLLRNSDSLPGLSPALGTHFSGNGDLLGFVRNSPDRLDPSLGPVITGAIRLPDTVDGGNGRGCYIEDGGYPGFVDWLVEVAGAAGVTRRAVASVTAQVLDRLSGVPRSEVGAQISAVLGNGQGARGTLPLLGMGRDVPDGRLGLRGKWLDVDWNEATSRPYLDRLTSAMSAVAEEMGGDFVANPTRRLHRLITAHPLGGCPMADDPRHGVVDAYGEAFGIPGLFVADGSIMPGPVGANPSLTIAAMAERISERVIDRLSARDRVAVEVTG